VRGITPALIRTPQSLWYTRAVLEDFTFRPLESRDQQFLREALFVALWDPPDEPRGPRSVLDDPRIVALIADWGQPGDAGFVAQRQADGQPVGAVWIRAYAAPPLGEEYLDARTPHLGIAVLEGFQGRGIGSALISRALEAAGKQYPRVALTVHPRNPARRLYERCGFQLLGPSRGGYLVMQLDFGLPTIR